MPAWNCGKNAGCISLQNSQADSFRKVSQPFCHQ
ncbi:jg32, partial [Pararge aegeria aegeria]